jgi:hypothetical protein
MPDPSRKSPALVRALEEVVVEVAIWLILLPRTLYLVARWPGRLPAYLEEQGRLDPPEQFAERLPPVLFWILLGPVALFTILRAHPGSILGVAGNSPGDQLLISALIVLPGPLGFAWAMVRQAGHALTRDQLAAAFRLQCYPFGVFALAVNLLFLLVDHERWVGAILFSSLAWLGFAQVVIAMNTSKLPSARAFLFSGAMRAFGLVLPVILLIAIVDLYL